MTLPTTKLAPDEHLQAILAKRSELDGIDEKLSDARKVARDLKQQRNALNTELMKIITNGPDPQRLLSLADPDFATPVTEYNEQLQRAHDSLKTPAPDATVEPTRKLMPWRERSVSNLELPADILNDLNALEISTLGEMNDWWAYKGSLIKTKYFDADRSRIVGVAWYAYVGKHPECDRD